MMSQAELRHLAEDVAAEAIDEGRHRCPAWPGMDRARLADHILAARHEDPDPNDERAMRLIATGVVSEEIAEWRRSQVMRVLWRLATQDDEESRVEAIALADTLGWPESRYRPLDQAIDAIRERCVGQEESGAV